jgi:hypothetical protein
VDQYIGGCGPDCYHAWIPDQSDIALELTQWFGTDNAEKVSRKFAGSNLWKHGRESFRSHGSKHLRERLAG